jgi:hypothetical protein
LFDVGVGRKLFETSGNGSAHRFSRDDHSLAGTVQDGKLGIWQVGDCRECRTLEQRPLATEETLERGVTIAPGGRLLAAALTAGIGLWDCASGSLLRFIPSAGTNHVLFEPSGALLHLSVTGLARRPLSREAGPQERWVMGPPEQLPLPGTAGVAQSRDGRVIATCVRAIAATEPNAGGWILHTDRPDRPIRVDAGADIGWIAVSHDGRWVVTVTHHEGSARVWHAEDGRLVKELVAWGSYSPQFTADALWFSTGQGAVRFRVGTWDPIPQPDGNGIRTVGGFALSGRLMAIAAGTRGVSLVDTDTGRELATLQAPHGGPENWHVFAPDGTKLVGLGYVHDKANSIRVWDLALIRARLRDMGLDWDGPELPSADTANQATGPLELRVAANPQATNVLAREQAARRDIDECRRAHEARPDSPEACNNLAWSYLIAPEPLRDVKAAVPLAEKAARMAPAMPLYRVTLCLAYYRAGRCREAVETLRPNLEKQESWALPFDMFVLAMCRHKLGDTTAARDDYDFAVRWMRAQDLLAEHAEDLAQLRAEAEELLGISRKQD